MTERMLSPVLLLLASLAMGLAHMHPALSPLEWLSVLALTLVLRHRAPDAWGAVAIWVEHPWHLGTIRNCIQSNQVLVGVLAIALPSSSRPRSCPCSRPGASSGVSPP